MNKSNFKKFDVVEELLIAFQNEDLRTAVEKEYLAGDNYAPYWITKKELNALSPEVFIEKKNDRLTVYKDLNKRGIDAYVTKVEIPSKPEIRQDAENLLDALEFYNFKAIEFEGKKFIGVKSKHNWSDSRLVLSTKTFQKIKNERYGESAYVVTNANGLLLVFSSDEDPFSIANEIIISDAYFKENEFEVFLIDKNRLISKMKYSPIKHDMVNCVNV